MRANVVKNSESIQIGNNNIPNAGNLTHLESSNLVDAVQTWGAGVDPRQRGFFLARKLWDAPAGADSVNEAGVKIPHDRDAANPHDVTRFSWKIASLESYEHGFFDEARFEDCYVCFADPSNYANAPGWMLRNLLVLVKQRWGLDKIQVLLYRDVKSKRNQGRSVVMALESSPLHTQAKSAKSPVTDSRMPKVTGWERSPAGRLAGRTVDLTEYMDPRRYIYAR